MFDLVYCASYPWIVMVSRGREGRGGWNCVEFIWTFPIFLDWEFHFELFTIKLWQCKGSQQMILSMNNKSIKAKFLSSTLICHWNRQIDSMSRCGIKHPKENSPLPRQIWLCEFCSLNSPWFFKLKLQQQRAGNVRLFNSESESKGLGS